MSSLKAKAREAVFFFRGKIYKMASDKNSEQGNKYTLRTILEAPLQWFPNTYQTTFSPLQDFAS